MPFPILRFTSINVSRAARSTELLEPSAGEDSSRMSLDSTSPVRNKKSRSADVIFASACNSPCRRKSSAADFSAL